jgi:hypothetical protein
VFFEYFVVDHPLSSVAGRAFALKRRSRQIGMIGGFDTDRAELKEALGNL